MMSIIITVYIIIAVLVLILINYLLTKRGKNRTSKRTQTESMVQMETSNERVEPEEPEMPAHLEINKPIPDARTEKNNTFEEPVADMLKESAVAEPALEYVQSDVELKKEDPERVKSRTEEAKKGINKGRVMVAVMLGAFVAILNQTLLNVAIPHIMNDLGVSANTVQWLSTGYMLVNGIFIPITAFLIDKFGTKKLFTAAMIFFTAGSIICSISTNFSLLMTGRIVQAAGAGIIMPLLMTIIFALYPPEKRGAAMGVMGIVMIFAPAVGPTLSGWLILHYSWRLLFDIVIPIGTLDIILCLVWLRDVTERTNPKFDFLGFIFSSIGFGFLLYGFSEAGNDGWSSGTVISSLVIAIIALIAFVIRELTTEKPMLELRVFKYDIFSLTTIISMIINMAMMGAMILLPIYLQNIRGYTALQSGLLLLPGAIIMGIMSPISGKLFDKIGSRPLAIVGLAITVITTWQFTKLSMSTSYSHILLLYVFRMFGMSFLMMTVMTEGLNQLPRHLASHGTAASNTARTVAGSIGTAFLVTIMSTRQSFHYGDYQSVVTSTNPFIAGKFAQLGQGLAAVAHLPAGAGQQLATSVLYGQAMQQATIEGINDAFVVATGIAVVALILAFFIKRSRVNTQK
ncbi:DHA2 family efflux MFS transporter permease subunit [Neobacillus fumarioli]|uniref:DHA2 family efflux MFS transporter permease subunit n=1 Tax=Neobacillus fumarioli TaxID=105229 RepID=UPI000A03DD09|nr:DHA2 family efflux MFS transporter permease subunit [Neobacillus fumarioli]